MCGLTAAAAANCGGGGELRRHGHLCVVFQYPFSGLGLGGGNRLDVVVGITAAAPSLLVDAAAMAK